MSKTNYLDCISCQGPLRNPITLSCGYTSCSNCLSIDSTTLDSSLFICPAKQCNKKSHLFGPNLAVDQVIQDCIKSKVTSLDFTKDSFDMVASILTCPIGNHYLEHPITTHCGHTFCKLCLLQDKISTGVCKICQERLPSYSFIQSQPSNYLLSSILSIYIQLAKQHNGFYTSLNQKLVHQIPISTDVTQYKDVPIYLTDFTVLPSQKLVLPIYSERHRSFILNSLLLFKKNQWLCFALLHKNNTNHKNQFGAIVQIKDIKQQPNGLVLQIMALDRFQVINVNKEVDDFIKADISIKFEGQEDTDSSLKSPKHWTDYCSTPESKKDQPQQLYSPSLSTLGFKALVTNSTTNPLLSPLFDPIFSEATYDSTSILLSHQIHTLIEELASSTPTNSFSTALDGLLGPVWLESVQNKHGKLPPADHAVAICWWSGCVLPVSNTERYELLQTKNLDDRLNMILSWINDLKTQWITCRRTAMRSATKIGQ